MKEYKKYIAVALYGIALFFAVTGIVSLCFDWYTFYGKNIYVPSYGDMLSKNYFLTTNIIKLAATLLVIAWVIIYIFCLKKKTKRLYIISFIIIALFVIAAFMTRLNVKLIKGSYLSKNDGKPIIYDYQLFAAMFGSMIQLAVCMLMLTGIPLYMNRLQKQESAKLSANETKQELPK